MTDGDGEKPISIPGLLETFPLSTNSAFLIRISSSFRQEPEFLARMLADYDSGRGEVEDGHSGAYHAVCGVKGCCYGLGEIDTGGR